MCCYSGKISLPALEPPPPELYHLLTTEGPTEKSFHSLIHNYNSTLAMTSVGRKLDHSFNQRGGRPYSFRLHGELIHRAGSLLPPDISKPDIHCGVCGSAVQIVTDHHSVIVAIVNGLISGALHRSP
jgi:hypothetical protein